MDPWVQGRVTRPAPSSQWWDRCRITSRVFESKGENRRWGGVAGARQHSAPRGCRTETALFCFISSFSSLAVDQRPLSAPFSVAPPIRAREAPCSDLLFCDQPENTPLGGRSRVGLGPPNNLCFSRSAAQELYDTCRTSPAHEATPGETPGAEVTGILELCSRMAFHSYPVCPCCCTDLCEHVPVWDCHQVFFKETGSRTYFSVFKDLLLCSRSRGVVLLHVGFLWSPRAGAALRAGCSLPVAEASRCRARLQAPGL